MKYNPKRNERVAALPGFARLHPLSARTRAQGMLQLLYELQKSSPRSPGSPPSRCSRRPARRAS